ncbi:hypothetical protein TNCV_2537951 [Trichonephila clavipes]|nr:hypothetical protein TNCV_2537951 [Trichonephila clavipes]
MLIDWGHIAFSNKSHFQLGSDNHRRLVCRRLGQRADIAFNIACHTSPQPEVMVLDESRSFFRVHTGYFSNIPKCIKAEFIASWACSQSSVVSSSQC